MERFNSNELIEFDPEYYTEGEEARNCGIPIQDCPYLDGSWKEQSWRAGWVDADMLSVYEETD